MTALPPPAAMCVQSSARFHESLSPPSIPIESAGTLMNSAALAGESEEGARRSLRSGEDRPMKAPVKKVERRLRR